MTEKCISPPSPPPPPLHFNINTRGVINMEAESTPQRSDYKTTHCLIYGRQQRGSKVKFLPFTVCSHSTTVSLNTTTREQQSCCRREGWVDSLWTEGGDIWREGHDQTRDDLINHLINQSEEPKTDQTDQTDLGSEEAICVCSVLLLRGGHRGGKSSLWLFSLETIRPQNYLTFYKWE